MFVTPLHRLIVKSAELINLHYARELQLYTVTKRRVTLRYPQALALTVASLLFASLAKRNLKRFMHRPLAA